MLQNGTSHPRLHGNGGDKRNGGFEHIKVPIYPPGSLLHIVGMRSRIKNMIFLPMNIAWARIGCWVGTRIYNWSDTWLLASKNLFLIKNNNVCYTCYDRANSGPFSVHQIIFCEFILHSYGWLQWVRSLTDNFIALFMFSIIM